MIVSDVITVESAPTSRNSKECGVKVSGKGRKEKIGSSEEDEGNDSEKENNNSKRDVCFC